MNGGSACIHTAYTQKNVYTRVVHRTDLQCALEDHLLAFISDQSLRTPCLLSGSVAHMCITTSHPSAPSTLIQNIHLSYSNRAITHPPVSTPPQRLACPSLLSPTPPVRSAHPRGSSLSFDVTYIHRRVSCLFSTTDCPVLVCIVDFCSSQSRQTGSL